MLKSSLGKHVTSNLSPDEMERLERKLWLSEKRKVLVDVWELQDDNFKQQVIEYANNKFKGKR